MGEVTFSIKSFDAQTGVISVDTAAPDVEIINQFIDSWWSGFHNSGSRTMQQRGQKRCRGKQDLYFPIDEREYVPGQKQQIAVTKDLLDDEADISSLESVSKYFKMLYHFRGEVWIRKIF